MDIVDGNKYKDHHYLLVENYKINLCQKLKHMLIHFLGHWAYRYLKIKLI